MDHPVSVAKEAAAAAAAATASSTSSTSHPSVWLSRAHRIPPGYSVQVFDFTKSAEYERLRAHLVPLEKGLHDPYAISISFAKGWGARYKRADVLLCPCWLQVCLEPPKSGSAAAGR